MLGCEHLWVARGLGWGNEFTVPGNSRFNRPNAREWEWLENCCQRLLYPVPVDIDVTTATEGQAAVVTVQGAVDLASRGVLIEQGTKALTLADTNALVVDLGGVTFIDSTGVGALVELAGQADDIGRDFTIRHPSDRVVRILDVTGLLQLWTIESAD